MAITVTRRAGGGRGSFAQSRQRADSITYTVQGIEARALKQELIDGTGGVFQAGLPALGTFHPELQGGLVARSYNVTEEPNGDVCDVDVVYATSNASGSGLLYAVPDLDGGQFVLSATFETAEVYIPFCVLDKYTVANPNGDPLVKPVWRVETMRISEPRVVLQARWQIRYQPGQILPITEVQKFEAQHGKIHQLGGRRYVFTAGSIMPRDNQVYEVTASWTGDNGTPLQTAGTNVSTYRLPPDMGYVAGTAPTDKWPNAGDLMRSPFHVIDTVPDPVPDDPNVSPICVQVAKYAEDLDGYQTLPGVPFA